MAEFKERKRWLFLGLPWTFTIYTVKDDMITIDRGFLNKQQDDCYMYKVQDVELIRKLSGYMQKNCFCPLGQSATTAFISALKLFPEDFDAKIGKEA